MQAGSQGLRLVLDGTREDEDRVDASHLGEKGNQVWPGLSGTQQCKPATQRAGEGTGFDMRMFDEVLGRLIVQLEQRKHALRKTAL
jgi:hypothetical protein